MTNADTIPKKSAKKLFLPIIAIVLIVIIIGAALSYYSGGPGASDQPNLPGTYVEQTSSGTGYSITLYENGTALFSTYSGTWHIVNSTTFEGTYRILSITRNDFFTITNDGFTAVSTGNVYIKK